MYGLVTLTALVAAVAAAPAGEAEPAQLSAREGPFRDSYTMHYGDGSVGQGWTRGEDWAPWDQLWNYNAEKMKQTCGWNGGLAENSAAEIAGIKKAILKYADQSLLDKRFILAIIMQESKGCVRVRTTTSPDGRVRNPGIMQSHNGSGSCEGRNPCPDSVIDQMVKDGVLGTSSGDGLRQTLTKGIKHTGTKNSHAYYRAAREYNSGSITEGNLNDGRGATNCYASDVCNRLSGWLLNGKCSIW